MTSIPQTVEADDLEGRPRRPCLPADPGRVWLSLRSGWRYLLVATVLGAVAGTAIAFLYLTPTYKSETVLVWEPPGEAGGQERDLSTQAGIIKLPVTLEETRRRLHLGVPPKLLDNMIDVWFERRSNLVTVEASWNTAEGAAKLADTAVAVFLDHQRALTRTRAMESAKTIEGDMAAARAQLDEAQARYDAFRSKHGISDFEADLAAARGSLSELETQRDQAATEATALEAQGEELGEVMRHQPRTRVQSASRSNPTAAQISQLQSELAVARSRLAADHPTIARLEAQISSLRQQNQGGEGIVSSVVTAPDMGFENARSSLAATRAQQAAANKRRSTFDDLVTTARDRVNRLTSLEGEASSLIADVSVAKQRVTALTSNLARAREAARMPPAEFRVLTPAVMPEWPERSRKRQVMVGLTLLGFLIALGGLIVRPLSDGKVYTAREAAYWARLPVIASSVWPSKDETFRPFVDELNDHASVAEGTTLVVGVGPTETALASELVPWLGPGPLGVPPPSGGSARVRGDAAASNQGAGEAITESGTTSLVLRDDATPTTAFYAWTGEVDGHTLRRAARMADRVVVLVSSGSARFVDLAGLQTRLGRENGVGIVMVGVGEELMRLPDRVGDVAGFWTAAWQPA